MYVGRTSEQQSGNMDRGSGAFGLLWNTFSNSSFPGQSG
jgi:hypothetical protein